GPVGDPRNWTDINTDGIAQVNEIGPSQNPSWGIRPNRNPAPNLERPYDLLANVAVEQQLGSSLGVAVSYNRRQSKNIIWTDQLQNVPADYQLLTVADPRGNGQVLPVYQLLPGKVLPLNQLDENSSNTLT